MKPQPAMQALVAASKLNLSDGQNGKIECPKCTYDMDVYRTPSGKLMGRCENCELVLPKA